MPCSTCRSARSNRPMTMSNAWRLYSAGKISSVSPIASPERSPARTPPRFPESAQPLTAISGVSGAKREPQLDARPLVGIGDLVEQPEAAPEMRDCPRDLTTMRSPAGRPAASTRLALSVMPASVEMAGDDFRLHPGHFGKPFVQRTCDQSMIFAPRRPQQRLVGDVLQQGVFEPGTRARCSGAAADDLRRREGVDRGVDRLQLGRRHGSTGAAR